MTEHTKLEMLVCCDKVIEEAGNGKKTVIGIFRNFNFPVLPATYAFPWFIFAQITGLDAGAHAVTMNVVHDQTQGVVLAAGIDIPEEHPENADLLIPVQNVVFQKEGKHVVSLNIDGQQLGYSVLTVSLQLAPMGGT
jgi:hypothetical protein